MLEKIRGILESRGERYNEKHSLINSPFVFSVSTLARGIGQQAWYKSHDNKFTFSYESPAGQAFLKGRSIHEFIQKRLTEDPNWKDEVEIIYDNGSFVLLGHIDALNLTERLLCEIKTTQYPVSACGSKINIFKLQAGCYSEMVKRNLGIFCEPRIFLLNETITEFTMSEIECYNAFKIIEARGFACLAELKKKGSSISPNFQLQNSQSVTLAQRIFSITGNISTNGMQKIAKESVTITVNTKQALNIGNGRENTSVNAEPSKREIGFETNSAEGTGDLRQIGNDGRLSPLEIK